MTKNRSPRSLNWQLCKPVVASALAVGGLLNLVSIVLADGTTAGTPINNTATATYNDPADPNNPLTSVSNMVTIEVAEIAGITVVASGIAEAPNSVDSDNDNDSTPEPSETIYFDYTVTNVGNDPTLFRIPNSADVTGPGSVNGPLEVSYDGGLNFTAISGGSLDTTSISPGGNVIVRVPVEVNPSAQPGDAIDVQLGNTPGDAQNQPYDPDGGDVYTVDGPDGTPTDAEVDGDPVNGTREASDTQGITINNAVDTRALVVIEKEMTGVDFGEEDPAVLATPLTDNQISYDLSFTVDDTPPLGSSVTPGPLYPTGGISVDGTPGAYILISDAVPANTVLVGPTTAPAGWTPVYTADTLASATDDATTLDWYTDINNVNVGGAATATRVGFINTAAITSIAPGATVGNFSLTVDVDDAFSGSSLTVGNIAQIFGASTPDTTPTTANDPNDDPISDESGDQTPSNYNSNTDSFDPPSDGELPDANGDGIPDELDSGDPNYDPNLETDSGNNNTGSGPEGEANVVLMNEPTPGGIVNGPDNQPGAIGPTDNNDDFTNKSTNVSDSTPGTTTNNPGPVNFTNSVQNTGTVAGDITIEPTPPNDPAELPGTPSNLTQVIIVGPNGNTATYSWDGTSFTTNDTPIVVTNVQPGEIVDYGVEIDLPLGTPLSTDADATDGGPEDGDGIDEPGFPVPITASIDTDPVNNNGFEGSNITIDRVYTGFLKLIKESRILQGDGPAVQSGDELWSDGGQTPAPGNIIEYRVIYTNISEPASGTGNVVLNADNVVVTEDGTGVNGNNWALDNDNDTVLDTSNIVGSATDSRGGTIDFYNDSTGSTVTIDQSGTTANSDVTKYVDTVPGSVAPGESDYLTFQRRVN